METRLISTGDTEDKKQKEPDIKKPSIHSPPLMSEFVKQKYRNADTLKN